MKPLLIPVPRKVTYTGGKSFLGDDLPVAVTDAPELPDEAYELRIANGSAQICASSEAGVFYARQSLQQLQEAYGDRIPAQHITDAPRFKYRGVHMDVVRHFQDKEFVKKQLRMFASVKINTFHFHQSLSAAFSKMRKWL